MSEQMDQKALWPISYGIYIISSCTDGKVGGQICNTVTQTSAEPPKVLAAINKQNYTHEIITESRAFVVTVLSEDTPLAFIGRFGFRSGRDFDKFEGVRTEKGVTGCPVVLDHAVSVFEARVYGTADAGTHTVFLADVVAGRMVDEQRPMTYARYHAMKGKAPRTAPTYRDEASSGGAEEEKKGEGMKRYVCNVCGYVYDPADGDPDGGIEPGTAFEGLPDDWVCPVCGAEKSEFSPE